MEAPADMHSPPSLPPSPSHPYCTSDHTLKVEIFVIVGVVGMLLFHLLGSLRRQTSHGLLHATVSGVDTLAYPLVTYTIGWMNSSDCFYYDFAVWAVCLLLLLSNTDSLTVCRLNDIDNWKAIYVKHLFKGFMVVFIVLALVLYDHLDKGHRAYMWPPVFAILFICVLKSYVRIASMRMVSKSYLFKNTKVIDEYMKEKNKQMVPFHPVTMKGCMYVVAGEKYCIKKAWDKVTTVEQIWQCEGKLLLQKEGEKLKDICLSMALGKMLNRRFAGFKLSDVELEKSSDLVFKGLLGGDKPHQRVFRVIEEELIFVHDLYYTRYSYLQQKGRYFALYLPVIMFALCSWLTYVLVKNHKGTGGNLGSTIFIAAVLAFLEAYQLYLYIASGWFKVALIQTYVSIPFMRSFRLLEMIRSLLLRLKAFRPWKDTLGQYCLLGKHGGKSRFRNCLHYATLRLVDKAKRRGQKSSVKLSEDVKEAIIHSLVQARRNAQLMSGVTSPLNNNGVHDLNSCWASHATATDGGVTHTIVVWHIATTLCWQQLDAQATKEATTASTLSKYCMYLIAFAPNLLPDNMFISESILDKAIDEADKLLKKHRKLDERCRILMQMEYSDRDDASLLSQGANLARCLMGDKYEATLRWKVLSDFWAGMMLYIAPSDDARAHLEVLARGGEFITHIWALLTHAGVLKRGHTTGPNGV